MSKEAIVEFVSSAKFVALMVLLVQTTAAILLMRKSRLESSYIPTTAVIMAEIVKIFGGFILARQECDTKTILSDIISDKKDFLMIGIPGVLYMIQNNLLFVALSNLSGAVYQITYQLKILTTGILSVIILGKVLSNTKWAALVVLMFGVIAIQITQSNSTNEEKVEGNFLIGMIAVLSACITSALAGVSLEKMIKGTPKNVWTRSIQVAIWGLIAGIGGAIIKDGQTILEKGFCFDYSLLVWAVILIQAIGGMTVAAVMKYADNILKCFANAASIIFTILIEGGHGFDFLPGTVMVIVATTMYGLDLTPIEIVKGIISAIGPTEEDKKDVCTNLLTVEKETIVEVSTDDSDGRLTPRRGRSIRSTF